MPVKFRKLFCEALFGASFFCAAPTMAMVSEPICSDITGNGVTINECSNGYWGSYSVVNASEFDIYKFFVSTQATAQYQNPSTNRTNWGSSYISENSWNAGAYLTDYGSFDSLFGLVDTGVFSYFHQGESQDGVLSKNVTTGQQFFFNAPAASEFIAINDARTIISRSFTETVSNVPEPGSLALLGFGVVGLAVARRKR